MSSSLAFLIEALDNFLEAQQRIAKQRAISKAEAEIKRIMRNHFSRQGRIFAREHKKYRDKYPLEEAIGDDEIRRIMAILGIETREELEEAIKKPIALVLAQASENLLAAINTGDIVGIAFDLKNPKAVEWLTEHAATLVQGIDKETWRQMNTLLRRAGEEGQSYARTAKQIRDSFDDFSRYRSQLIAVTEARDAYEQANLRTGLGLKAAGLEMEKSWMVAGNPCDDCEGNGNEGWIDIEDTFSSGDDAPPSHPNCLCDLLVRRVGSEE